MNGGNDKRPGWASFHARLPMPRTIRPRASPQTNPRCAAWAPEAPIHATRPISPFRTRRPKSRGQGFKLATV
ncbi:Uncharacterized protein ChrSV_0806 [Chromobacterium vaccinii]|nr:Uncharacterized protein ChrSW_0806 [Chromobacterium vaccinii]QND88265.1 Uncharacterized protein ChrSV_0806 [Chromobacterium vaccinii]